MSAGRPSDASEIRPAGLGRGTAEGGALAGRVPAVPLREPPIARSILWRPVGAAAATTDDEHPAFITQDALREVSRHIWTSPDQDVLGFLLGERYDDPVTRTRYVVVTATTRSSYVIAEDEEEQIPEDAWHAAHVEGRRRRLSLLGWYHSAPVVDAQPSERDVRSHRRFFPEPWQIALIAAPRAEAPAGGIFRTGLETGAERFLAFYEVAGDDALLPDGRKRTVMPWENHVTDDDAQRTTMVAAVRPRIATAGAIPILEPRGHAEEGISGTQRHKPKYGRSPRRQRERRRRLAVVAAAWLVVLGAVATAVLMR
ncbi:MAG: Mov34/MPN/PAD-1 family protein [Gemmatimonadota bacterium]|nr:Mov34/MPN/PAD-1 family protein [Gemmatimonadota bacterium]